MLLTEDGLNLQVGGIGRRGSTIQRNTPARKRHALVEPAHRRDRDRTGRRSSDGDRRRRRRWRRNRETWRRCSRPGQNHLMRAARSIVSDGDAAGTTTGRGRGKCNGNLVTASRRQRCVAGIGLSKIARSCDPRDVERAAPGVGQGHNLGSASGSLLGMEQKET